MKPLKLSIRVDATEHFIYRGYMYIAVTNGGILRVALYEVVEKLKERYPEYSGVIDLAYRRNNFWNSEAAKCFLSIDKVKTALMEVWRDMSENVVFEVDIKDLNPVTVVKGLRGEVLDMEIYADTLLLGCTDGFYSVRLEDPWGPWGDKKLRLSKKFDAKIYKIASGYGNAMLSLGKEGLTAADILNPKYVKDILLRNEPSYLSNWTAGGGVLTYSSGTEFQFMGNKVQRSKESPDNYEIIQFDSTFRDFSSLLPKTDIIASEIQLSFNGRDRQFYVVNDGSVFSSEVKVSSGKISRLKPQKIVTPQLDLKENGRPLSGLMVADQQVIEFDDSVVLVKSDHKHVIEDEGIVSMHTYPRSTHFRDVISITADECVNLHAIDVFDYRPEFLFADRKI